MGPGCHFDVCDSIELCIVELTRVACISFSFMLFDELQRFLGEFETNNVTDSNNEKTTFGLSLFHVCLGLHFCPLFYEFSAKILTQKV